MKALKILAYTIFHRLFKHRKHEGEYTVVVFPGHLGDAILFCDLLNNIYQNNNKCICICGNVEELFKSVLVEAKIQYFSIIEKGVDNKITYESFRNIICTIDKFSIRDLIIIDNGTNVIPLIGVAINHPRSYYTSFSFNKLVSRGAISIIINHSYTGIYNFDLDIFLPRGFEDFYNTLLGEKYKCKRVNISTTGKKNENHYCVFSPLSAGNARNLSYEQCLRIIEILLSEYEGDIYITGICSHMEFIEKVVANFRNQNVINFAGKTNLKQLFELIEEADFMIGIDSGHIHVASSVNTPSICITGLWDYGQFLPYRYDNQSVFDPFVVLPEKQYPCQGCKIRNGNHNRNIDNEVCFNNTNQGGQFCCLESIDYKMIRNGIAKVKRLMSDKCQKGENGNES